MGKEPLTREEYDEAVDAYIDEYRRSIIDTVTFTIRLITIGMDRDEVQYLVRTTRR